MSLKKIHYYINTYIFLYYDFEISCMITWDLSYDVLVPKNMVLRQKFYLNIVSNSGS